MTDHDAEINRGILDKIRKLLKQIVTVDGNTTGEDYYTVAEIRDTYISMGTIMKSDMDLMNRIWKIYNDKTPIKETTINVIEDKLRERKQ